MYEVSCASDGNLTDSLNMTVVEKYFTYLLIRLQKHLNMVLDHSVLTLRLQPVHGIEITPVYVVFIGI